MKFSGRVIAIERAVKARDFRSVSLKNVWIITAKQVDSKLLDIPSVNLPYIIMAEFCAKAIRSHPMLMPMFPITVISHRPHNSIAIPPRRQPTGLEIAYTLAVTREIIC
jgi:hypothetical protein